MSLTKPCPHCLKIALTKQIYQLLLANKGALVTFPNRKLLM